jgi:hypothetical protein
MPVKHRSVHAAGSVKTQLAASKPPAPSASYPVHARAFAGFAPAVVQSTGKEPARNVARYNPNWGESLIAAVLQDSAVLCREALADDCAVSDVNTLVAGGSGCGAPFVYADTAFFTEDQLTAVAEDLQQTARVAADRLCIFVAPKEWAKVDAELQQTACYGTATFKHVSIGDTGEACCKVCCSLALNYSYVMT